MLSGFLYLTVTYVVYRYQKLWLILKLYLCNGIYEELVLDVYETKMTKKSETWDPS